MMPVPCEPGFGVALNHDAAELYPCMADEGWR
jgi:hypothetical protein